MIRFTATVQDIANRAIAVLPSGVSAELPSRGMVMVEGALNGVPFLLPLEPDGRGSHWFLVADELAQASGAKSGDTVQVTLEPVKSWPEPTVPDDVAKSLHTKDDIRKLWDDITPAARWDWLRWIRATNNPATRAKRIDIMLSKLKKGDHRPCCFNRTICTDPNVSKRGLLLRPE